MTAKARRNGRQSRAWRKAHPNQALGKGHPRPAPDKGHASPDTDPGIAATVHLLHRRRGWAWVLASSLVALLAVVATGASLRPSATSAAGFLVGIIVILLLALSVVALIAVITDTGSLRRRDPAVRMAAVGRTSHHPVAAHPFRTPVHHYWSHVFVWFILSIVLIVTAAALPDQVNAFGYVAGAGKSVTFMPQSYSTMCGRRSCTTVTGGVLQTDPPVKVSWPAQVPLGQPFSVREPIWDGWTTPTLMNADVAATGIGAGLVLDLGSAFVLWGFVHMARRRWRSRGKRETVSVLRPAG